MFFVESTSMGVRYRDFPFLTLHAERKADDEAIISEVRK